MRGTDIEKRKKNIYKSIYIYNENIEWAMSHCFPLNNIYQLLDSVQLTWDSSHSMARFFHVIVLHLELYSRASILFEFIQSHISNGATSYSSHSLARSLTPSYLPRATHPRFYYFWLWKMWSFDELYAARKKMFKKMWIEFQTKWTKYIASMPNNECLLIW